LASKDQKDVVDFKKWALVDHFGGKLTKMSGLGT
jgi:hypothetical protein